jgi:hypothetical protein
MSNSIVWQGMLDLWVGLWAEKAEAQASALPF